VLVDANRNGSAMRCCSLGRLPVSAEHLRFGGSTDIEAWMERVRSIAVDFVVVDAPSHSEPVTRAIMAVSESDLGVRFAVRRELANPAARFKGIRKRLPSLNRGSYRLAEAS